MVIPLALKVLLGLVVVGGGVALASTAGASEGPDPGKGEHGERAGIRFEGCKHFELVDLDAAKAWAAVHVLQISNALGDKTLEDLREDPELGASIFFDLIFPECQSFEDATFGPERLSWPQTLKNIKAQLSGLDAAGETEAKVAGLELMTLIFTGDGTLTPKEPPPKIPKPQVDPVPKPPMDGAPSSGGEVLELVDEDGFKAAQLLDVLEPKAGETTSVPRTIFLGYSEGWTGSKATLERMMELAAEHTDVEWVVFSFVKSRELFGQPDAPIAYVATAVDPDGAPMGDQVVSSNIGAPPLPEQRWGTLLSFAREGYVLPPGSQVEVFTFQGKAYTIALVPPQAEASKAWGWWVWDGPQRVQAKADASGSALGEDKARQKAKAAIVGGL